MIAMILRIAILSLLLSACAVGVSQVDAGSTGQQVFEAKCSHCHAPGLANPGTHQLAVTRGEDRAVLEQRTDLAAEYVEFIVRHGLNAMPAFAPTDVTEAQLVELAAYLSK